ncbi:MAG TPA: PAS domain-containing protein [Chitinophagaceae bacterium]|nr:PAS domain-containing protein [Chitinophagaceae bacterium]
MNTPDTNIDFKVVFQSMPGMAMIILPNDPDYTIVDATDDVLLFTKVEKENLIGKNLGDVFPDNPGDPNASGLKNLRNSLKQVISTKKPHHIEVQRYDVKNENGNFDELYWSSLNTPVLNNHGAVDYILHTSTNITEQIQDKKEAKAQSENYEYYLRQAAAPLAILTGDNFIFTFANEAYTQLMNGRQLVGKSLEEAIPELKGQPFILLLKEVFETGIPFHASEIEATALFEGESEPTKRYFNLSYTPYKDHNGITEGVLASGYDVTKEVVLKRENEKQVLNLQAYNLFMQVPVGFSLLRGNDHILELVNSMALRYTGKNEDSIGKPVVEVLPEIEKQGYIKLLDRVKKGESFNLKESPVILIKDEKEKLIYMNIFFQPYYEDKNIEGVLAVFMDVTEQVITRKKIEEMGERFETMANNIPNLAWIANADGYIFWYNNRWYEYTGTTPQEMEGWGWKSVHDPKKLPAVLQRWQLSINDGKPFEMVFPIRGSDNVFRPFLTRVVPIRDNEGKIIRWLGTNTDITKQKEVERMKDDFISMASHELKTPLTTIKAYGQIAEDMLQEKGDVKTLEIMKRMSSQVNKLTTLIEDLLDVTKIQKGKLIYKEDFFDFNDLLKEVTDDMQRTSATHKIKNNLDSTAKILGDRNKISQVIDNLISNGIKYSPKANKIIVGTRLQDNGVQLSVQDFGIGILYKDRKKIFAQFYRVSGENQFTFPGMGIGLYICQEIIARHGGKIWLESKIGKGSVFYVWLPFDYRNTNV